MMTALTIHLQEDKYERLTWVATQRQLSVTQLMEDLSTRALAEFDGYLRFLARATQGHPEEGLALLEKLDALEEERRLRD